ncbi:MAG: heme biosynthesis protein HemY [Hyphomicrobiales bacterium]|nr:MAG: heme biosynthesis protein HemY [Hyphomicrobiales bacterium]
MIRLIVFFAILFAVALGASWLADRPGTLMLDWQGYQLETSVMVALLSVAVLVVAGIILWSVLRGVVGSPRALQHFFGRRRREKGTAALKHGFIAVGSGNVRDAQKAAKEARKFLKHEPATLLLTAQSAQLSGDRETARKTFESMLDDDETRLLGLHGLFVEAKREGESEAARHYVEEAAALAPSVPWAGKAQLEFRSADGDWEGALKTLAENVANKLVDKKTARRQRAVLLTARGLELEDGNPDEARKMAVEAHGLAPELVTAAALAGRLLSRAGDFRKAAKILEAAWKKEPHPEIAEAYLYLRPGDSARDRLKRAKTLNTLRSHHAEGALALARVAIELHDFETAREALTRVLRSDPTERACLMMAEVEEGEHGDQGRMREWLARAVKMPRDPAWIADGYVAEEWAPISPVTGRLDAFEWKVPVAMLAGAQGPTIEDDLLKPRPVAPVAGPALAAAPAAATAVGDEKLDAAPAEKAEEPVVIEAEPAPAPAAEKVVEAEDAVVIEAEAAPTATPVEKETSKAEAAAKPAEAKSAPEAPVEAKEPAAAEPAKAAKPADVVEASAIEATPEGAAKTDDEDYSGLPFGGHAPDDPGPLADDDDVMGRGRPRYN